MTVRVCCYDNPNTMAREAWQNKRLICKLDAAVLLGKAFKGGSWFPFILNCGPWESGKIHYGDSEALTL